MAGNDLHSDCVGSLACAELKGRGWSQVSPVSHPVVKSDISSFSLLYASGSSDACPLDRKDIETRLEIDFQCGTSIGTPEPAHDFISSSCT